MIHEEMVLREQLAELKQQMSEENLELIPNYEQRVEVLKELKFVDPVNVTVSLKGRVACEVSLDLVVYLPFGAGEWLNGVLIFKD